MADFLAQVLEFRLQQIGGPAIDDVLLADGAFLQIGVDRRRRLAVTALQITLYFVGDGEEPIAAAIVGFKFKTFRCS